MKREWAELNMKIGLVAYFQERSHSLNQLQKIVQNRPKGTEMAKWWRGGMADWSIDSYKWLP